MNRAAGLLLAVAYACEWLADVYAAPFRWAALFPLVVALVLLCLPSRLAGEGEQLDDEQLDDEQPVQSVEVGPLTAGTIAAEVTVGERVEFYPTAGGEPLVERTAPVQPVALRNLDPPTGIAPAVDDGRA